MRHRVEPGTAPATAPVRTRSHLLSRPRSGDAARLERLAETLDAVLAGDLTRSIDSGATDRLGAVERSVDALVAGLLPLMSTVQQGSTILHDDRLAIAASNKEMLDAAEMTAGNAYDVGVAAESVSDSIGIVASATEELASTVNDIARHATLAADVAVTAATQGELAERGMAELSRAVSRVEGLATVIATIAGQTRLLALNATIEAARAGDAGLGFAVVADEVKGLSRATAEATEQVQAILEQMQEVSSRASEAILEISATMGRIVASTSSIASAVVQQTATTREIGRVSEEAARNAEEISGRVAAVHQRARDVAYASANGGATKSESLEQLEASLRGVSDGFDVGGYVADMKTVDEENVDQEAVNRAGTTVVDGVTSILDVVLGTGLDQFDFTGSWLHGPGYPGEPSGDAYSCLPGDRVTMRFVGTRMRFWGYADQQQGMAELSIDGQHASVVDFYSPVRGRRALWESPVLPYGEHVFSLEVLPKKSPDSRYFWVSVAMVDIFR